MEPFRTLTSVAAPLPESDIDTDIIFPARFLLLLDKKGLGELLFNERRRNRTGNEVRFVLDQPTYARAQILVTGARFGTGSSREQAVWALAEFGIRCVMAPSFGEIFFANCYKNGVLPVVVSETDHADIMAEAHVAKPLAIDLAAQCVRLDGGRTIPFAIDAYRKRALLLGLDDIGAVLADDSADIASFEARQRERSPWLYLSADNLAHFADLGEQAGQADAPIARVAGKETHS